MYEHFQFQRIMYIYTKYVCNVTYKAQYMYQYNTEWARETSIYTELVLHSTLVYQYMLTSLQYTAVRIFQTGRFADSCALASRQPRTVVLKYTRYTSIIYFSILNKSVL